MFSLASKVDQRKQSTLFDMVNVTVKQSVLVL
jgi:hypothetical protein